MISHHIYAALARQRRNTLLAMAQDARRARQARSDPGRGQAVLRDGSRVLIRQVRSEDAPLLADGFGRLSARSRWMRFMMAKPRLTAAELRYLTDVDHRDHEALGALDRSGGRGVGIARYVRDAGDPQAAEIAVTVVDEWQGRGLGTVLLARLSDRARQEGIGRFTALAAADNLAVARLLAGMGADVIHREAGTLRYELELAPAGEPDHGAAWPAPPCLQP
jgi:RimJ/RimL family protein N-acetyltransferase